LCIDLSSTLFSILAFLLYQKAELIKIRSSKIGEEQDKLA